MNEKPIIIKVPNQKNNTLSTPHCPLLIVIYSLLFAAALGAQEPVAMHPMIGPPETQEIAAAFFDRARREVVIVSGGKYIAFNIDLSRLPPDVPEGGFPPWICPSPSITASAAYAITGEAAPDPDTPEAFRMRLYLWKMEGARLLGSDEMTVTGPEDLEATPAFIEWVLSWIVEEEPVIVYVDSQQTYE